jgi:hypothetical protein
MKKIGTFLKEEFLEMLPPTIFFFVVFHIVAFTRALMAKQYGIMLSSSVAATIGALIVGKAILIADALPFVKWFCQKRLIYNVAWRTFLYVIVVLIFQFLEELIPLLSEYGTVKTASEHVFEEILWPQFWATHILLVVFLLIYNVATGIIGAIGRHEFFDIFFSSKSTHGRQVHDASKVQGSDHNQE